MGYCMNQCGNVSSRLFSSSSSAYAFNSSKNCLAKKASLSYLNIQPCPVIFRSPRGKVRVISIRCEQGGVVDYVNDFTNGGAFHNQKVGKRTDIKKILILGAGPIVIGQACEFDYSGTQACKALREEGYEVILINSNPATIMTDPDMADRTYIEPMTPELVEQVLQKERPDALLPTMGGQTALNLAVALAESGALEKYGVELIGAKLEAIKKAEDRELFKQAMKNIGIKTPPSGIGTTLEQCFEIANSIGEFPLIIRPAFTLGGTGGGIAYNREEFEAICKSGLAASLTSQVLVEKSLLGWKEYELEVMRDLADNVVIICSIENIDPMGVHTGDSITVAPAQTLTDKEYQRLRDYSIAIIREIGVECGGSNVQFAVNPVDGEVMVIEMNPRVSRSSALASKATGFPIAKMAAKLSVGYSLDQIPNDITKKTPASFEPSIDYVVTKIPRFAFEKFPGSEPILTTQMKSVGESMAVGRTFQESFQKAVRSLECGYSGWGCAKIKELDWDWDRLKYSLRVPNPDRMHSIYAAMKRGMSVDEIHELSYIDKWFLTEMKELVDVEQFIISHNLSDLSKDDFYEVKKRGFSDKQIAFATKSTEKEVRLRRLSLGVKPAYKRVDTCAAEFEANTPYMYSSYDLECESLPTQKKKVLILGGGPNRIGQGIEFDYCCCHTSFALQDSGYETIMMNSNPETVSTDYDTSDRLYFEPLTVEDVLNVIDLEGPDGIIVQFGGQTPLKLSLPIQQYLDEYKPKCKSGAGFVRIWGTSPDSIDAAEDRERFNAILKELQIEQPKGGIAKSDQDALAIAAEIGYPVVVRPSYVLGGQAMEIVYSDDKLVTYLETAVQVDPERPVLIDKYLSDAIEIDVDSLSDQHGNVVIGGIMEHIEQAGVHSGDSACMLPTQTVSQSCLESIRSWTTKLAKRLNVCGLMNCQYAITVTGDVFLLEANPRASRQYSNSLLPKCMNVVDLGCSSGPNSFFVVKEIIKSINKTCWEQQLNNCQPPSVQVFLNDLISNDFNTLFKMLPKFYEELENSEGITDIDGGGNNYRSCCHVAVVPGSFYGRLFPDHSIHFLHSSNCLHWLSQVPIGLVSKFGEPLNKKNICIAQTSSPNVCEAYMDQFANDFTAFLKKRSQELVLKGHLVLTFLCKNDEDDGLGLFEILGNTLHDMVSMGMIDEGQLASFNIPLYEPSIEELKKIIEVEGSFTLKRLETFKLKFDANNTDNSLNGGTYVAMYVRAGLESFLTSHFGENCMNDLFEMYGKNISMCLGKGKGILNNVTLQLVNE